MTIKTETLSLRVPDGMTARLEAAAQRDCMLRPEFVRLVLRDAVLASEENARRTGADEFEVGPWVEDE